ncbi:MULTISPECIES: 50S ribosomal protein L11 methyltransferase [Rhodobacterales]|jgi:ribosomal protein L11 methyltransferase|uniref:Ribosomal protein L11 methyltransferase n=1 Tax=Phaeobacter gallaeciensis TaxID=60890 RepID=A0A1B0ZUR7_9RHOB|nr:MULTISPECIES: 50S ribosomal protein L11 methyltransferase [Phaeobacter]MDF1773801.1 50S ribosomal protein L11 methyltransferase [Pseudophaeobacter sp. bin_em_oilr2.035]MEE2635071.1 50S ribosomal protein L11 methyltransferase [Pseudomonadota bacterium]ANP37915.1 ribosomal L11 methyltransferase [Phaeobacter gallaeciensis]MDE4060636.1 50S ribosomal protein L11 methyltransferase [Phaeobacter gallaeciensis]MDE4123560.1 50S ribosomal protein L11 methyltransferase [Phaeobacter gallaeciensis]
MPTFTALTTLTGKAKAEALGDAMERLTPEPTGVGVFEVEDGSGLWEVGGYFTEAPDEAGLALLAAMHEAKPFAVSELPETDWVAHVRRELAPVEAGRFFVYGSHDADKVPGDKIPLLIEAAMAFGTGHHGTTLGCLRALDHLIDTGFTGAKVADIGCGTAVLAMAAARVWDGQFMASDIDQVAVEVAEANLKANDMGGQVTCLEAAGFDHPDLKAVAPYDLIFANILKGPLVALSPDIAANLRKDGFAILSGILNEQADDVIAVYAENGLTLRRRDEIGEWTTLLLQKES